MCKTLGKQYLALIVLQIKVTSGAYNEQLRINVQQQEVNAEYVLPNLKYY